MAILLTVMSLVLTALLFRYLEEHPEKENWFLCGALVLSVAGLIYITFKPYPMDSNAEGKLIVDPQKMMNDGYGDIGKMIGFILARFVEKNWIRFKPLKKSVLNIGICLLGLIPMVLLKKFVNPLIVAWLGSHWGKLVFSVIYVCYYLALFPIVLKMIDRKQR